MNAGFEADLAQFDAHGYLLVRAAIRGRFLARLCKVVRAWIDAAEADHAAGRLPDATAFDRNGRVTRINAVHALGATETLELLAHPTIRRLSEALCGPSAVCYQESLVRKTPDAAFGWHQDTLHGRTGRWVAAGLYLDASTPEEGGLRLLPGSQRARADLAQVDGAQVDGAQVDGAQVDGAQAVCPTLAPGDLLLHDVMLVHGSPALRRQPERRTLYLEICDPELLRTEGYATAPEIAERLRVTRLAMTRYAEADAWRPDPALRPGPPGADAAEIAAANAVRFRAPPANYAPPAREAEVPRSSLNRSRAPG